MNGLRFGLALTAQSRAWEKDLIFSLGRDQSA